MQIYCRHVSQSRMIDVMHLNGNEAIDTYVYKEDYSGVFWMKEN